MFSAVISAAVLLLSAGNALAAPQTTSTGTLVPYCVATAGPFALQVKIISTGLTYPARLLVDTTTSKNATSHIVLDTNFACTNCGTIPNYWDLKDGQLIPVDSTAPRGTSTVNLPVSKGSDLSFITSAKTQPAYPIYCGQYTGTDTPRILSVNGSADLFTMCAFTSRYPPPTNFDIVYDKYDFQPVGVKCTPVKLVLGYIGIQ